MGLGPKGTGQICELCHNQQATRALYFGPQLVVICCKHCARLYSVRAIDPNAYVSSKITGEPDKKIGTVFQH